MITGKIYITILDRKKNRGAGICLAEEKYDKSVNIPFEINRVVSKNLAYYSLVGSALKQYVHLVSLKRWPKYDNIIIYLDKEANLEKGIKFSDKASVDEITKLIELVGGVDFKDAEEDDPYYLACVGTVNNYLTQLEEINGRSNNSTGKDV